MRTRVLLLPDTLDSPLHRIAQQVQIASAYWPTVDVEIVCYADFLRCSAEILERRVDIVVCLWYGQAHRIFDLVPPRTRRVLCVYEGARWALGSYDAVHGNRVHMYRALQRAQVILVANASLQRDVQRFMRTPPPMPTRPPWRRCDGMRKMHRIVRTDVPVRICTDGVDIHLFHPQPWSTCAFRPVRRCRLRVGWAGNSAMHGEYKGVDMIRAVCNNHPSWLKLCLQDASVPHADMPVFYASIDVYVCMSSAEGTPNTVLEAMACARPFVSTRVGVVPRLVADAAALGLSVTPGLLLQQRSADELCRTLRALYESPRQRLIDMGAVGRYTLEQCGWSWSERAHALTEAILF